MWEILHIMPASHKGHVFLAVSAGKLKMLDVLFTTMQIANAKRFLRLHYQAQRVFLKSVQSE